MILVTGGFGFIGLHLVRALLAEGRRVHVVDDLRAALPLAWTLPTLPNRERLTFDRLPVSEWLRAPSVRPSLVYHLASPVGPAGVLPHRGRIAPEIVHDTAALADACTLWGARLVFVSTSEVYGDTQGEACHEGRPTTIRPIAAARVEYAAGKLAAEHALRGRRDVDSVIVRPFNVAGPGQSGRGGFVLPRFVGQALTGQPLTVFGDGTQVRAFTHVEDIVSALTLLAERGDARAVYNVGNDANRGTVGELAALVAALLGGVLSYVDPRAVFGPDYVEAPDKWPDASAMLALGWRPTRDRATTVADTAAWLRGLGEERLRWAAGLGAKTDIGCPSPVLQ